MTVGELIRLLQEFDEDRDVFAWIASDEGQGISPLGIEGGAAIGEREGSFILIPVQMPAIEPWDDDNRAVN